MMQLRQIISCSLNSEERRARVNKTCETMFCVEYGSVGVGLGHNFTAFFPEKLNVFIISEYTKGFDLMKLEEDGLLKQTPDGFIVDRLVLENF
jgi:hypothetical protein